MSGAPTTPQQALAPPPEVVPEGVLAIRLGPGANCSSIGSVIDILFVSAAIGGAVMVALAAALRPPVEPPPPDTDAKTDDSAR